MAFYESDGRRNYYVEFGSGRPVILLHGITNSGRAWGPQIAPLVGAGFRVVIPDHAGHGASGKVNRVFRIADIAEDTRSLMRHLGIGRADFVGLSLGGMIVFELALEAPALVNRMVIANSLASTASDAFRKLSREWAATFRTQDGPITVLEQSWGMMVNETFQKTAEGMRTFQIWHGVAASADGDSLAFLSEGIVDFDVSAKLTQIDNAVLFIAGETDAMSPPDISRKMAEAVPHSRFVELAAASHISNVDSPERFNAAVIPFLLDAEDVTAHQSAS
jgi:3-oxoadipate enol-lactonase